MVRKSGNMKKISLIILTVLLCFVISVNAINIPAPFERAKSMALKVQSDSMGRHLINMTISKNGEETIYIIGYIPHMGIIGIGKLCGNKYAVYEYNERTGEYTIWKDARRESIEPKLCIREAFVIFREMVTEDII
jgi:hypothetical protein